MVTLSVRARNAIGLYGDLQGPSAPVISAADVSSASIEINLITPSSDPSGVARYELERSLDGVSGWTVLTTNASFPYASTGLSASTEYFYRCRAVDTLTNVGAYSAVVSDTTQAAGGDGITLVSNTLTINRSAGGLGSKGATHKWDTFESSTVGALMSSQGYLIGDDPIYRNGATPPVIATDRFHSGSRCARMHYTPVDSDGTFPKIYIDPGANTLEAYFSCWGRWEQAGTQTKSGIFKLCRMTSGQYGSIPQFNHTIFDNNGNGLIDQCDMGFVNAAGTTWPNPFQGERQTGNNFDRDGWHFLEWYYRMSTPGVANGAWHTWIDGTHHTNQNNILTRSSSQSTSFLRMVMMLFDGLDSNSPCEMDVWQDETAIERGDATTVFNGRRLIGTDNATYAASTNWAFQQTQTWIDTAITQASGQFNRGTFASGSTMHLHAFVTPTTSIYVGSVTVP